MNLSQAITEQRIRTADIADVQAQIDRLRQTRDTLAEQLAQIEAGTAEADAEHLAASAALSAAITAHALGEAGIEDLDAARARSNRAAVALASMSAQRAEAAALKVSINDIEARMAPLGQRIQALLAQSGEVTAQRLRERITDADARLRGLLDQVAAVLAEGRAIHAAAMSIGKPGNFATAYLGMQTLVLDGLGESGRIVVDLDGLSRAAVVALKVELAAEGFEVA